MFPRGPLALALLVQPPLDGGDGEGSGGSCYGHVLLDSRPDPVQGLLHARAQLGAPVIGGGRRADDQPADPTDRSSDSVRLGDQLASGLGDGRGGEERHVGDGLLEAAQAVELPDRLLHVAAVATRLGLDQEPDRPALHLAEDGEIQDAAVDAWCRVNGADLDLGQPGEGFGDGV